MWAESFSNWILIENRKSDKNKLLEQRFGFLLRVIVRPMSQQNLIYQCQYKGNIFFANLIIF